MKSVSVSICKVILTVILSSLIFLPLGGCTVSQPGETTADGHRRHQQEMMADIDKVLLLDKPSKLTEKRIY